MKKLEDIPFNDLLLKAFKEVVKETPRCQKGVGIIADRLNVKYLRSQNQSFELAPIMSCVEDMGIPSGIIRAAVLENTYRSPWDRDSDTNRICTTLAGRLREFLIFGIVTHITGEPAFYGQVRPCGAEYSVTWMIGESYLRACVDRVREVS